MAGRVTVVEFVGAPGVGKSRLMQGAIEAMGRGTLIELPEAGYRWVRNNTRSRTLRALLNVLPAGPGTKITNRIIHGGIYGIEALSRFALQHDAFLSSAGAAIRDRRDTFPEPELFIEWVLRLGARYQQATESVSDGAILLLEEGFATRGVGLFGYGWTDADDPQLKEYIRTMPRPDLVIAVDASVDACRRRLEHRGWTKRSRGLSAEGKIRFLEDSRLVSTKIADELERLGVKVVRIRSEDGDDGRPLVVQALEAARS